MPVDYYPNKSMADLQVMLDRLQSRQYNGSIAGASAAGVSVTRTQGGGNLNAWTDALILRVRYSLYLKAIGSDEADNWPNPYATRNTRTRAYYREESLT